jgi:intracellular septation protein
MKLLFDFLPVILFFGTFKYAEAHKAWAADFATRHLGLMVSGGKVGPGEAPVLLATVVVIAATLAQVAWLKLRGRKVDTMLWVSLTLVAVLGGLTVVPQRDLHQVEAERAVLGDGRVLLAEPPALQAQPAQGLAG